MVEHKMVTIDGIRYRPEDAARVQARRGRPAQAMSTRAVRPEPETPAAFHPGEATVEQVLEYLAEADYTEAVRVLAAEEHGKGRSTILAKREEILDGKEVDDNGDPDGDAG